MGGVMIGIDPHKGSHTAFALDASESKLGQVRVRATVRQVEGLLEWADRWPERSWAIEGAHGLGYLLAQQLLAAGERVLDVQPKLAARVRLLNTGHVNKNDPNDARSVAIAALRSPDVRTVATEDHAAVMKLWARRHRDLSRTRNRIACRLHAVLCELVPGGFAKEITAGQATQALAAITPLGATAIARLELAHELLDELRTVDEQRRATKNRITRIVAASKTSVTDIYGVGPIVAATVLGYVADVHRFPTRDHFAAYNGTAPIEASSGNHNVHRLSRRGNRQLNHAIHMAAVTQIRYPNTIGRAYYDRKIAEGMKHKSALRALKRKISDAIYARMISDARPPVATAMKDPGGQTGNDSVSSAAGSHPEQPAHRTSHSRVIDDPTTNRRQPQPPPSRTTKRPSP
ncbi:MAG TPA: IS110 family transposase [Jatrophihabitantaceae bacterium]